MKRAALILFAGLALARPLAAQGLISPEEHATMDDQKQSEVIPHRDLLADPQRDNEVLQSGGTEPILDERDYLEFGIPDTPMIGFDRETGLLPDPRRFPFDSITPRVGYTRAKDEKWDFEPRIGSSFGYDNNLQSTTTGRKESSVYTASGGMSARLGSLRPRIETGEYDTPYTLLADYEASYNDYFDHDELNALNQTLQLQSRIGRGDLILTPFLTLSDVTERPLLDVNRTGLIRRKTVEGGTNVEAKVGMVSYHGTVTTSMNQQPQGNNIDFDRVETRHEFGLLLDRTSRPYMYGAYRNQSSSRGSYGDEVETGVGYDYADNSIIIDRVRWRSYVGWADVTYRDNPFVVHSPSGLRFRTELGGYFTEKWEWSVRAMRSHYFDDYVENTGRVEDEMGFTTYFRPNESIGIGLLYLVVISDPDTSDQDVLLHRIQAVANFSLSFRTILFTRVTYEHNATENVDARNVVGLRESVGFEVRF